MSNFDGDIEDFYLYYNNYTSSNGDIEEDIMEDACSVLAEEIDFEGELYDV